MGNLWTIIGSEAFFKKSGHFFRFLKKRVGKDLIIVQDVTKNKNN